MINSRRKNFYLILCLDIVLLGILGLLVWQINEEQVELTTKEAERVFPSRSDREALARSWPKLESRLSGLNNYFVSASTTVALLKQLEGTAQASKVTLKINQAEAKNNLKLNFSVLGPLNSVSQFLLALEKLPYALRLERLDLKSAEKDNWRGDFIITILIQK